MDLVRAAFLLESELSGLTSVPAWKRRDLENVARASIRAMRDAAAHIERLESAQRAAAVSNTVPLHQLR